MSVQDSNKSREIADKVPADSPGALEIGFTIPERYNASRILFDNLSSGRRDRPAIIGPAGTRSLRRTLRRRIAMGARFPITGAAARRSHP